MSENKIAFKNHNIVLEDRSKIKISGVEEVENYNEHTIVLSTIKGAMTIKGEDLSISKLNLDDGSLNISGTINSLIYMNKEGEPRNLLGKIFK